MPPTSVQSVRQRLGSKLAALPDWNSDQARHIFVEHILLAELGDNLALDPGFADLVKRVNAQLASDPRLGRRLDDLLQEIAKVGSTK